MATEMKRVFQAIGIYTLVVLMSLVLARGCNQGTRFPTAPYTPATITPGNNSTEFRIVAENGIKPLHDAGILDAFSKETSVQIAISYRGSVDIRNAISNLSKNRPQPVDAYWPGSSLWLSGSSTVEPESIMKTYVVLAVEPEVAQRLGWSTTTGISAVDLVNAIEAKKIELAMTTASQSTPGAAFYLAMFTGLTGKRVLTSDDLDNDELMKRMITMLKGIERSAGDLNHLEQLFIEDKTTGAHHMNAIVIYESLAIQMNNALIAAGQKPMLIFYINGATAIADAPIRYVDNGYGTKLEQYHKLVAYLGRPDIQKRIQGLGWRTDPIGMKCEECDPTVFNPAWGISTTTEYQEMIFPKPPVTMAALDWYQAYARKPSFTVYCLDYSASMDSGGKAQMVNAMDLLLDQNRASAVSLQATPDDIQKVYGFSSIISSIGTEVQGNDQATLKNLSNEISEFKMSDSTAMFDCVEAALQYIGKSPDPAYNYSVIVLTDGGTNVGATVSDFVIFYKNNHYNIPVYGIAFGSADFTQLDQFRMTGGDVYDGRQDVAMAFRMAKGNN